MPAELAPSTERKISMPPAGQFPGLKRGRHQLPYWIARQCARDPMGFPDKVIALPPDADDATLSRLCHEHTARLRQWIATERAAGRGQSTRFEGTVLSACRTYQQHPLSRFHSIKHNTRATYVSCLKLIEQTVGQRLIRNVTVLDIQRWYDEWRKPAAADARERIDRAHDAVSMFRTVLWFMTALRSPDCKRLAEELRAVKFEKGGARQQELTYTHATAFIRKALELEASDAWSPRRALFMAIGVAAQFELIVRQRDVIGEWTPNGKLHRLPEGIGRLEHKGETWSGFFTWEAVPGWRWRMRTSKSKYRSAADYDLTRYPLLFPLLEQVPHAERFGAIVKGEHGLPVRRSSYGKWFRQIARAAGIPDEVWNMDSRAGGVTEAEEAGVPLDILREAATHADARTTVRYIRRRETKIAAVADARSAKRAKDDGGA